MTEDCTMVADDLNKYMDWTLDPCEDFYGLVCNKFIDEHKSKLETQSSGMSRNHGNLNGHQYFLFLERLYLL